MDLGTYNKTSAVSHRFLVFIVFLIAFSPASIRGQDHHLKLARIDSLFDKYDRDDSPGLTLGIVEKGKLVLCKSYGMADVKAKIPITDQSVFSLASVSKQFTAYAVLMLAEDGLLDLQDDVRKYLPNLKDYGAVITIEMLINHTSGLRDQLELLGMSGLTPDDTITTEMCLDLIYNQEELNFSPGSSFSYSNSGYVLLAEIVENSSGLTFPEFMQERVFRPLGMNNSLIMDDLESVIDHKTQSYNTYVGGMQEASADYTYYGATNLYTNPNDLLTWILNLEDAQIGSNRLSNLMNTTSMLSNGSKIDYGMGQMTSKYKGEPYIWHSGSDAGYRSFLGRFRARKAAIFLLSNHGGVNAQNLAMEAADIYFDFAEPTEEAGGSDFNAIPIDSQTCKLHEGEYIDDSNFNVRKVECRGQRLFYVRPEQNNRESELFKLEDSSYQIGIFNDFTIIMNTDGKGFTILEHGVQIADYRKLEKATKNFDLQPYAGIYHSNELGVDYTISITDEQLICNHSKFGDIHLERIIHDGYRSNAWQFQALQFKRDKNQKIVGFTISSSSVRNVSFDKIN